MRRSSLALGLAAGLAGLCLALPLAAAPLDPDRLAGMKARSIGPAAMSGRIAAVAGVEANPDILYIGAASGGVWKSVNGGLTWTPLFDDQPVSSIGDVAVFQPNPDIVWVGTGEGNVRNSVSAGNGVYRSLDGGRTWKHLGLTETERIHRVVLHPTDPDTAWVAAMGRLWGENPERGVFKTTDGGKTWKKVLYVDERTGAAELVVDPSNPRKLFAALWDFRRQPWTFRSGGPGSGLYVSWDGGDSWQRLTEDDGLPKGDLGRIGVAISRSNPAIVYALVEAEKSALVRSDDGGRTWKAVNETPRVADRPFYYADLRVDPVWPNRVYNIATRLTVSDDGGKSFSRLGRSNEIHGDFHALWISPSDPELMVTANDGGLGISRDRGETWSFVTNLPLAQYYHVAVDMDTPYNVYGGLQDNGSWRGPSAVWEEGAIRNHHWARLSGGDGFDVQPETGSSRVGYAMSQAGFLLRWNLDTREVKTVRPPAPDPGNPTERLRFNWNAGLAVDPFEPATVYYGSQYLHKSSDRGESWTAISPDLTTNKKEWQQQAASGGLTPDVTGAENFTTIVAVAPSPVERGVIWVGTDDGRVHVTRDGGKNWASVEKNLPGVPAYTWVPHIRPSKFDGGGAFLVLDDHRRSNWTPYVLRTDDYGKTWKSLATPNLRGWALSIEQDPVDRDLLFLGTEMGLYASFDGGKSWLPWRHGVPTTPVADLVIHPRDHDLVVATHGRALYIVDDIAPLREMSAEALAQPVHLYPSSGATLNYWLPPGGASRSGAGDFKGENRPYGAILTYSLNAPGLPLPDDEKERARKEAERTDARARALPRTAAPAPAATPPVREDPASGPAADQPPSQVTAEEETEGKGGKGPKAEIRITDASGQLVRKLEGPAKLGVNRLVWDLSREPFRQAPQGERGFRDQEGGPTVAPGTYTVTVKHGGQESRGTVRVLPPPGSQATEADWQAREAAIRRVGAFQDALVETIERIAATRKDVDLVLARLEQEDKERARGGQAGAADPHKEMKQAARQLRRKLSDLEKRLFVPPDTKGIVDEDAAALSQVEFAEFALTSSWDRPNPTQTAYLKKAEAAVRQVLGDFNRLFAEDVAAFRRQVQAAGIGLLPEKGPVEVGR